MMRLYRMIFLLLLSFPGIAMHAQQKGVVAYGLRVVANVLIRTRQSFVKPAALRKVDWFYLAIPADGRLIIALLHTGIATSHVVSLCKKACHQPYAHK